MCSLTSTCFFPNEIGNAAPALQLTDTQLQRAHEAFNMMQISTAYLKGMGRVRLGSSGNFGYFLFVFASLEAEITISSLLSFSGNQIKDWWSKVVLYYCITVVELMKYVCTV